MELFNNLLNRFNNTTQKQCVNCHQFIDINSVFCEYCGSKQTNNTINASNVLKNSVNSTVDKIENTPKPDKFKKEIKSKNNIERQKGESLLSLLNDYTVIDIETTGLNPHKDEIIELSALKVRDNKIVDKISYLVQPNVLPNGFITNLTGITTKDLKNSSKLEKVIFQYAKFIGNDVLVGHNINFDINFINSHYLKISNHSLNNDYVDTLRISRKFLKDLKSHTLVDVATYFNIQILKSHRGLADCETTYLCYEKLKEYVNNINKTPKKLLFDDKMERQLLSRYNNSKDDKDKSNVYYSALPLIDFYYKYRDLDKIYIDKCIDYCNICISCLNSSYMQRYVRNGIVIPAFKKLLIIYTKQEKYGEALEIIEKALKYKQDKDYYNKKKINILKKYSFH